MRFLLCYTLSVPLKMTHFSFWFVPTKMTHYLKWKPFYLYFISSLLLYSIHLTHKIKLHKIPCRPRKGSSSLERREYYGYNRTNKVLYPHRWWLRRFSLISLSFRSILPLFTYFVLYSIPSVPFKISTFLSDTNFKRSC